MGHVVKEPPRVSIIIAIYNSSKTLRRCLDSVITQTLFPSLLEVILILDASSDNSEKIVDEYVEKYPQIKCLRHPENKGLLEAHRTGFLASTSPYIMYLDSDDAFATRTACEIAYAAIKKNNVDIVSFCAKVVPENESFISIEKSKDFFEKPFCFRLSGSEIFRECFVNKKYNWNTWSKIYKRSIHSKTYAAIPVNIYKGPTQDLLFYFIHSLYARTFMGIPDVLVNYSVGNGVSTKKVIQTLAEWISHVESLKIYEFLEVFIKKNRMSLYYINALDNLQKEKQSLLDYKLYQCLRPELRNEGKTILEAALKKYSVLFPLKDKKHCLTIVFFSHSSELAGAGRELADLVIGLSEKKVHCIVILPRQGPLESLLLKSNISTYVCGFGYYGWWFDKASFNLKDFADKMQQSLHTTRTELIPFIRRVTPDFIYSQTIGIPWGVVCARQLGIPHILGVREYGELDHALHFEFGFKECMEFLYTHSTFIFCITKHVRDIVFANQNPTPDFQKKCIIIGNAIRVPRQYLKKRRPVFSRKERPVKLLIPGWLHQSKGQLDAVRAVYELTREKHSIKLCLAGNSSQYVNELRQEINKLGLSDIVEIKPFNNNNFEEILAADIVLSCSKNEALGRTLFEAILLNRPIIYAYSGGPKEVFTNNVHGLAYPPGDHQTLAEKIAETIDFPRETYARMKLAKKYVQNHFNKKNHSEKIYKILSSFKKKTTPKKNIYGPHGNLNTSGISGAASHLHAISPNMSSLYFSQFLHQWIEPGVHRHLEFAYFQLGLIPWTSCEGHYDPKKNILLDPPTVSFWYTPEVNSWLAQETIQNIQTAIPLEHVAIFIRNTAQTFHKDALSISALPVIQTGSVADYVAITRQQMFDILQLLLKIKKANEYHVPS